MHNCKGGDEERKHERRRESMCALPCPVAQLSIATWLSHRGHSCSHGPGRSHLLAVVQGSVPRPLQEKQEPNLPVMHLNS